MKNIFLVTVICAALLTGCVSKIGRGDDYTFYVQFRDNESIIRIGDSLKLEIGDGAFYRDEENNKIGPIYPVTFLETRSGNISFLGVKVKEYDPLKKERFMIHYKNRPVVRLTIEDLLKEETHMIGSREVTTIDLADRILYE